MKFPSAKSMRNKLKYLKQRAKIKRIPFDLDYKWLESKYKLKKCEISRIPFYSGEELWYLPSVDRIDNRKGYTKNNCKMVLWGLNVGKGRGSYEELYNISKAFVNLYEEKNK